MKVHQNTIMLPHHKVDLLVLLTKHSVVPGPIEVAEDGSGKRGLIFYSPDAPVGAFGRVFSGEVVRFVEPRAYFTRLVEETPHIQSVLGALEDAPASQKAALAEEMVRRYWAGHGGAIVPASLKAALHRAVDHCGESVKRMATSARQEILDSPFSLARTLESRRTARVNAVDACATGGICVPCTAVVDLVVDLLTFSSACNADLAFAQTDPSSSEEGLGAYMETRRHDRGVWRTEMVHELFDKQNLLLPGDVPNDLAKFLRDHCKELERPVLGL